MTIYTNAQTTLKRVPFFSVLLLLLTCVLAACGGAGTADTPTVSNTPTTAATSASTAATSTSSSANNSGQAASSDGGSAVVSVKAAGPFTALRMLDRTHGWALSKSGIFKTADGGVHWINVSPAKGIPVSSAGTFMDYNHAWIASVSSQEVSNTVDMLRTSDGGKSWQHSTINDNGVAVTDPPHFVNLQSGWLEIINNGGPGAGQESAAIYHTSDGGQTWSKLVDSDHGFNPPGFKSGITFKDTLNGWATGHDASSNAILYVTHDGGKTWQPQTLPDLPGSIGTAATSVSFQTTPPVFFGNTGLLPVYVEGQIDTNSPVNGVLLYTTNDGGRTWFSYWKTALNALSPFSSDDLYIVDPQHAWGSDRQSGIIYATSDGGKSWQKLANSIGTIKTFSFVDASNGWAITDSALWRTSDGGKNWQQVG
jgi:photosystem II stability/assembly factor-like uncharacterized protein